LRLDLGPQRAATTDSVTGLEGGQRSSAYRLFDESTIFKVFISTVAYSI